MVKALKGPYFAEGDSTSLSPSKTGERNVFSRVLVDKNALNYFRSIARKSSPLEVQAYLAGRVKSVDEVEITRFLYTKNYHTQTNNEVAWSLEEFDKVKAKIEATGETIIGEAHSHPDYDAVMSSVDFKSNITQQLVICGICSVVNSRTRMRFWTPTSALPCKIIYK